MTMSGIWRSAGNLVFVLLSAYALMCLYLYFNQSGMLYLPGYGGANKQATPADAGLVYEELQLVTDDAVQLHAWYVPARQARGVILFCHGNAGTIADRLATLELLNELGFAVLIFDYRGYGRSDGEPSEQGTYHDAEAAWQYLRARDYAAVEIVIMGRSLGAAVAAQLADRHTPAALVLESSFTSVPDVAAQLYPLLPVRLLSRFSYNTLERLPRIQAPLLIVHSRDDEIIPYSHGRRLFQAANEPKQFLPLKGGHNDAIYASGIDYYRRGLDEFFQRYVDGV